jgi:hypothetical protein
MKDNGQPCHVNHYLGGKFSRLTKKQVGARLKEIKKLLLAI